MIVELYHDRIIMSGGQFDYRQFAMSDIANTIERDIARALKPKPEMEHEDYWVIEGKKMSLQRGSYISIY